MPSKLSGDDSRPQPRLPRPPQFRSGDARKRKAPSFGLGALQKRLRQRPTLPRRNHAVPSALEGFTTVFGMGTGGVPPISSPENCVTGFVTKMSTALTREKSQRRASRYSGRQREEEETKPHGRLVLVSWRVTALTPPAYLRRRLRRTFRGLAPRET